MATAIIPETAKKVITPETLRFAAKQSVGCLVVPVRLRRAIKNYLREQEDPHTRNKVLRLTQSLNEIKGASLQITAEAASDLVDDAQSRRWKIRSSYGDIGFEYRDEQTIAYVASRMPAVFSACYRVLSEVRRRLPGFAPSTVLDFGAGTGSAFWALREVWPQSLKKVNLIEPSQSMQRAGRSLIQGLKNVPLIHSYESIEALSKKIKKPERKHDIVIASYVLGEIPSFKDRITIVRQLWELTQDVLVLVEPGTPQGSSIISQIRSHILWMEKRKLRKLKGKNNEASKDLVDPKLGAYIVAPCGHDGSCPLEKTGTYCHFVQRLQRTSTQRIYKRSKGQVLRGFEDEKFSFVAFRRGQRPNVAWPLDGVKFETLKEQLAKRKPEDLEVDYDDLIKQQEEQALVPYKESDPVTYDSDVAEATDVEDGSEVEEEEEETNPADLGGGWGRIIFSPIRRGKQVTLNVCRSTKQDGTEGSYERVIITKNKNPILHRQARKSLWGDLWPF